MVEEIDNHTSPAYVNGLITEDVVEKTDANKLITEDDVENTEVVGEESKA